jgi:hypothetical protein
MKKRGFGVGRWSRFGGKVEKQETRWSKEKQAHFLFLKYSI